MVEWRNCHASVTLVNELNGLFPKRDKGSDGTIGDAAHAARTSDHNPWVIIQESGKSKGIVRARDIDKDGIPIAAMFEYFRTLGAARDPRLYPNGYLIFNKRITKSDFSGWKVYTGSNPHDKHGHISFSTNRSGYDSTLGWGLSRFAGVNPQPIPNVEEDMKQDERDALFLMKGGVDLLVSQLVIGQGDPKNPRTWGWDGFQGGTGERLTVVDNLRRLNTMAKDDDNQAQGIANLVINAMAPMMMDAVTKVMGQDHSSQANEIVRVLGERLKGSTV